MNCIRQVALFKGQRDEQAGECLAGQTVTDQRRQWEMHNCKHTILTRVKYVPVFAFLNVSVTIKIDFDFSTVGSIIESYLKIQSYIRNRTSRISFQKTNPAKCFGHSMH